MLATRQPRVLVADDQQDVVAAIRMLLRGAGLETEGEVAVLGSGPPRLLGGERAADELEVGEPRLGFGGSLDGEGA